MSVMKCGLDSQGYKQNSWRLRWEILTLPGRVDEGKLDPVIMTQGDVERATRGQYNVNVGQVLFKKKSCTINRCGDSVKIVYGNVVHVYIFI